MLNSDIEIFDILSLGVLREQLLEFCTESWEITSDQSTLVAARDKPYVCGRSIAEIAG
jgi:hypothetical protein